MSSSGNSCYKFPHLLFLPPPPRVYVFLFQLGFNVLSRFLYFSFWVCFDFFILKFLPTKGASLFNSCLEISAQWMQTAGTAWVAVSEDSWDIAWAGSTVSPWPPHSFAPSAGLLRACHGWCWFLEWGLSALDVKACRMFSHLKAFQEEIGDVSFYAHTLNFLCLASDLDFWGFFSTYGDCFQCVLIETGDICIPSLGEDGDLTDTWFELACYF